MSVTVKICGINSAAAADAAVQAGANFGSLALHPASPRYLHHDAARSLAERLRGRLRLVALLCDPDDEAVEQAVRATRPDFLQLHGGETPERVAQLRIRFGVDVIKAVPVAEASDLSVAANFENVADMLIFDAKAPSGAPREGGLGVAFDWRLLRGRSFRRPWLLAGGLTADNVARAISITGAPGVDVSSGVEVAPGQKSAEKIREFVAAARAARYMAEEQP
jgi:phosphoribosylanthranilate isomerase